MPTVQRIQRPWIRKAETQNEKKTDPFYVSTIWRKTRAFHLSHNPLCYYCDMVGLKHFGNIVDHYRPRKLYPELALDGPNLRTSCDHAHNIKRQFEKEITTRDQFERRIPELMERFKEREANMSIVLKYCLRTAYEGGKTDHPQKVMRDLGYIVTRFEGVPIGDCVFMQVDKIIEPLPDYLTLSDWEFFKAE